MRQPSEAGKDDFILALCLGYFYDKGLMFDSNCRFHLLVRAHVKGVKVSVVIAEGKDHDTGEEYYNFNTVC